MGDSNLTVGDGDKLYIGPNGAYITESSSNLTFYDATVAATKTLTQLVAGGSGTLDGAFDGGQAIDGAVSEATAVRLGGATDYLSVWQEGANDVRLDTSAGANINIDAAGGYINILSDTTKLGFGASGGAADGYIYHNGTALVFWDSQVAAECTLQSLLGGALNNPTITGAVTQTYTSTSSAYTMTADSVVTGDVFTIDAAALTTGSALKVNLTEGTLNGGYYFEAYDETGAATVFGVKEDGEIEITGAAASDMITVTAGNFQLDNGKFEVDTTQDITSYVKRNNATGTNAVLEVEQTHATGGLAVTIDQNATGDVDAVSIENAGTGYAVTTTAGAAGGEGYEFIAAASGTGIGFYADGATGSWVGANGIGLITAVSDGALAAGTAICRLESQTQPAAAIDGAVLTVIESGAGQATTYAVNISSTNNEALHVDAGRSLFDDRVDISVADDTGPALVITNPDVTGDTNAVVVTPSGAGAGVYVAPQETDTVGVYVLTATQATKPALSIIATSGDGWLGEANGGIIRVLNDGACVADSSMVYLSSSGQPAAANDGICISVNESGAAQATSYAVKISSTNNEALHVDAGLSLFDEDVTVANGANLNAGGTPGARGTTDPTNALNLVNGTAPVGAAANTVTFYAAAGEGRVMDSGGNSTLLSPHDEEGYWVFDSVNTESGRRLRVDMEKLVFALADRDPALKKFITVT
jgi:hypothetical protein